MNPPWPMQRWLGLVPSPTSPLLSLTATGPHTVSVLLPLCHLVGTLQSIILADWSLALTSAIQVSSMSSYGTAY